VAADDGFTIGDGPLGGLAGVWTTSFAVNGGCVVIAMLR
jgi:hypothetical protein